MAVSITSAGINYSASQTVTGASGASVSAQVLDHYEEGTWTPYYEATNCSFSYGGGQYASYTRIGREVFCGGHLDTNATVSGTGGGNAVLIKGQPFTAANLAQGYAPLAVSFYININFTHNWISFHFIPNQAYIQPYHVGDNTSPASVAATELVPSADSRVAFKGSYIVP